MSPMTSIDRQSQPLVSIVTPVYNNADHLAEAIESVLAQTYSNWDYTIVNNCSTDDTAKIAHSYAAKDSRIKVIDNTEFLDALANHNHALRQISPDARYCKVVFGDDWIYPQCIEEMVAIAEAHPSVAMVGAYGLEGSEVKWVGMPHPQNEIPGREVCRRYFLEDINVFGTANSLLFRADLVRARDPFYDESNWHADRETCIALLRDHNFGFVYQILTYTRERAGSLNTVSANLNSSIAGVLNDLLLHGKQFLTEKEYNMCLNKLKSEYYNFLAVSLMKGQRDSTFWSYHRNKLVTSGVGFSRGQIARSAFARFFRAVLNPYETLEKLQKG